MAHKAEIAHHVRGRLRMKIPAAKGDECLLEQVKEALGAIPGVNEVSANPATGSVILHYDPDQHGDFHLTLENHGKDHIIMPSRALPAHAPVTEVDECARTIEEEAEFLAEHSHTARVVVDFCKSLDREVKLATGNAVDLKVLFPAGLAVYTFLELGFEAATPVWLTLGLFAVNHFIEMHAHPSEDGSAPPERIRRRAPVTG
jgi:hypothetical protein